jgi:hypothetical protein
MNQFNTNPMFHYELETDDINKILSDERYLLYQKNRQEEMIAIQLEQMKLDNPMLAKEIIDNMKL